MQLSSQFKLEDYIPPRGELLATSHLLISPTQANANECALCMNKTTVDPAHQCAYMICSLGASA